MIYVGRGLPPIKEWTAVTEPALIDPALPVDVQRADRDGREMSYWPSYSAISPTCRSAYLDWLAGGRSDPGISIGYVFLFLYGLERRVLSTMASDQRPPGARQRRLRPKSSDSSSSTARTHPSEATGRRS